MPQRNHRLDRAKGALIFSVVLGHLLARSSPWHSDLLGPAMTLIYGFHMPAFVFFAGITAKSTHLARRVLTFLILLALTLPTLWVWMWLLGLDPDYDFLVPFWATWFLLSMAWWMLSVPLIEKFPRTMLAASLAIGLFGGLLPLLDYELSAARTLSFFPFFVIGKLYGKQLLDWVGHLRIWQKLAFTLAALAGTATFRSEDISHQWFYGTRSFAYFDVTIPEGVGMRLIVGLGACLLTIALLSWVGERNDLLATIGRRSLAVYIFHGFAVRGLQPFLDNSLDAWGSVLVGVVCLALALLITVLLSWWPFDTALRWVSTTLAEVVLRPFPRVRGFAGFTGQTVG